MYNQFIETTIFGNGPHVLGLQQTLTLQFSGLAVFAIFIIVGAFIGWQSGIRALLTVTLFSVIAYIVCVRGGNVLVSTVNRFYQNGPKLAAFAAGRDPSSVSPLPPLIDEGFSIPLFFRFILFIALIAFGLFFRKSMKWYAAKPVDQTAMLLGALFGGFTALLWISGLTSFWVDLINSGGGFSGPVANVLNVLPDVTVFVPSLIAIFFLLLVVIIVFNLPKLWSAGGGGKK